MRHSFLQTHAWLQFQRSIGRTTWHLDDDKIEANVIEHNLPFGKNYLYVPHGPMISFDEMEGGFKHKLEHFMGNVLRIAKIEHSMFIKFEPLNDTVTELLYDFGLRRSLKEVQPSRTVILGLTPDESQLLSAMHHKTRYNISLAQRKGLHVIESDSIETFWELLRKTSKHDNFSTHPKSYYEKLFAFLREGHEIKVRLYLVMMPDGDGERPIAGEITLEHEQTVYYLHGAMDRDYRALMAPYLMHWEIIKLAKSRGFKEYDFWGIDAQRWPGVTRFKLGFGGSTIERPGAFDLPVSKFWYFVYNLARKIRNV